MKIRTHAAALTLIALAVMLAGCEIKRVNESMDRVDATTDKADSLARSLRNQKSSSQSSVVFTNEQWVSTKPLPIKKGLPPSLDVSVEYNETKNLQQFAQWVSDNTGIPTRVAPDALDYGASYAKNKTSGRTVGPPPVASASGGDQIADLFPGYSGTSSAGAYGAASAPLHFQTGSAQKYVGKLSGLLDSKTGSLGLSWKYEPGSGSIKIFYLDTRQFPIYAFNKTGSFNTEVKSGMSASAGTSGSGGSSGQASSGGSGVSGESGSNQSTQTVMVSSLMDDIENNVRSMLTIDRMSFSRTTGVMSVTDRPDVLDRVSEYLDTENENITKQVLINVEVISVSLNDKDQYGIDWSLVYKSVSGKWGFGLNNTFPGIDGGAVNSTVSILDTASSPWAGSKAIIQALSQQGRVSSYRAPSVTTLNLQTAPLQIGRVRGYLASSSQTQSANVGSTTSLTPGSITSGFNMQMQPLVMPRDKLLLQLAVNMSSDPVFGEVSSGGSKVQTPNYDIQILNQSVKLRNGQTLVLSGFDQITEDANKSGTGSASNFWFGGGGTRKSSRDVVVLIITPIVLE
ncbi:MULTISPECIES: PilN family type IVB pilus formation outer membrane protein [unclassified Pseudomonas]|uniref:PilN family type IVB pilus formation outer membrane protein n=1 Tax=unclassified Pseudomonas TaxID=196821 RepID=UPI0015AE80F6|nr:PilN family type IVB pilus formation outer membrane protein [Pseudomonas sp. MWU12-2020]